MIGVGRRVADSLRGSIDRSITRTSCAARTCASLARIGERRQRGSSAIGAAQDWPSFTLISRTRTDSVCWLVRQIQSPWARPVLHARALAGKQRRAECDRSHPAADLEGRSVRAKRLQRAGSTAMSARHRSAGAAVSRCPLRDRAAGRATAGAAFELWASSRPRLLCRLFGATRRFDDALSVSAETKCRVPRALLLVKVIL